MKMIHIDKSNFRQIILDFPKQFTLGLESVEKNKIANHFDKIIICGMGGSALAGALLKMIIDEFGFKTPQIIIWRNYGLPPNSESNSLIIAISYSGNTEETLSAYRQALNLKLPLIAIARGGKIEELAKINQKIFIKIPGIKIPPRTALGYMFAILTQFLVQNGLIPQTIINQLQKTAQKLKPQSQEKKGKKLAQKIKGKIPLIYASAKYEELAHNWKIKFNENAKIPSFYNVFPELHHNEMNALENIQDQKKYLKNFYALIMEDEKENLRIDEGIKIFSFFLKKQGIPLSFISLEGEDFLEKIFNNLILADWTTYWLALKRNIDPAPTPIIEEFKKRMAS